MKYPGINTTETVMKLDKKMTNSFADFINCLIGKTADVGCNNAKRGYLSSIFNYNIHELNCEDFNFPEFKGKYTTILCFEVLEHLQNPLLFMKKLSECLDHDGTIYLSMPGRIRFMWSKHHFFEMDKQHFNKWILKPLDLRILRSKKVRIKSKITIKSFIGIRPIIRLMLLIFNHTTIYQIKKT